MFLDQFYNNKIRDLQKELLFLNKREAVLSFLRLLSFIITLVLFFSIVKINLLLSIAILISGFVFFGFVIRKHLRTCFKKEHISSLLEINKRELAAIHGNYVYFPDGHEYIRKDHPYTNDLDIFGTASLFQYMNRTTTKPGSVKLAEWLSYPATKEEILRRQEAVSELKDIPEWRQELLAIGNRLAGSMDNPEPILDWIKEEPVLLKRKGLIVFTTVLPYLSMGALIGFFLGLPVGVLVLLLSVNFLVNYFATPLVNLIHKNVSKTSEMLKSYSETILLLESRKFNSEKLNSLQHRFFVAEHKASHRVNQLFKLINKLDYRLNFMVSIVLNLFYFWDIKQTVKLEKWKVNNRSNIENWFTAMAEYEALVSISNLYFNNPDWVFPFIMDEFFRMEAEELGHPLIRKEDRVCNNLIITRSGEITLITGSNMSGKSTFLRTCGVNIVLAMTGSPVCAKSLGISHVLVYTSMRIIDSLEENTSSFYAELKRLASIIQSVERNDKVFLLLDEILRGTNSNDRHIGSVALIKQLLKYNAAGIIATHDLGLSTMESEMQGKVVNFNFDVKIEGEELYFDYKLNKGTCKSLNASLLMKKMGIEV